MYIYSFTYKYTNIYHKLFYNNIENIVKLILKESTFTQRKVFFSQHYIYAFPIFFISSRSRFPICAGLLETTTPTASKAAILSSAPPFPPEMMAPA